MKRRVLVCCMVVVLALSVVGMAFSAWQFGAGQNNNVTVNVSYDDIEENYSFSDTSTKKNISKEYTIYLFPSTLYLNDYIDYLDGKTTVKPEELYGNVQPLTDSDGNVLYQDGKVAGYETNYSAVTRKTPHGASFSALYSNNACGGDGGYIDNVINSSIGYEQLYLKSTIGENHGKEYDDYYISSSNTNANSLAYWNNDNLIAYIDSNGVSQDIYKRYVGAYEGDVDATYRAGQYNQKKYLYRNQHMYDKFGGWRTLDYGQGRYLPLKITVGADFAYSDFADLVLSSLTSMPAGDSADSINLTFTHWSYVDMKHVSSYTASSGSRVSLNYTLPYYAQYDNTKAVAGTSTTRAFTTEQLRVRNAYLGYTLEQYFDIMQDFDRYSDEYGVIRLFPTFSNGSNNVQSADFILDSSDPNADSKWKEGVDKGTGDGIYMFTASSGGNAATSFNNFAKEPLRDFRICSTMTTQTVSYYSNDSGALSSQVGAEAEDVRCSMYANLNINSINKLEIWLKPKAGATTSWENEELLLYEISEDVIKEIINLYGDGLYNLYLFVGNCGLNNAPVDMKSISNIVEYSRTSDSIFPAFTGKNLITLESLGETSLSDFGSGTTYDDMSILRGSPTVNGNSVNWPQTGTNAVDNKWCRFLGAKGVGSTGTASARMYYRPVMFAIEKVRDARVLMNLDIDEDGTNDVNPLWATYESAGVSFRLLSEDIYSTDRGSAVVDLTNEPLNEKYPYTYYLSGIDFTNSSTDYFQIRFQRRYRSDLPFVGTDGTAGIDTATADGGGLAPAINVIYNPKSDGTFDEDKRFINAFGSDGYFNTVTTQMEGYISPTAAEQVFFKLKSEEERGIYDLIIMYVPYVYWSITKTVSDSEGDHDVTQIFYSEQEADIALAGGGQKYTHKPGFYVFAYRHTNIFLKVVEKDPNETYTVDGAEFIKHNDYDGNRLLFQSVFQLGVKLNASYGTQVQGSGTSDINLVDYRHPGLNASFGKCVNTYIEAYVKGNPGVDISKIVLRDHVTKGIVGYYQSVEDTSATGEDIVIINGKAWRLVLEDLVIRKNYIFYIDKIV